MSVQQTWSPPPETLPVVWSSEGLSESAAAARLAAAAFDPHFREAWSEAQIGGLLGSPSAWLELGRAGDAMTAFALCRQTLDEVELLLCAVDPELRRRGLGRALVQQVARRSRERGAAKLFLEVRSSNEPAMLLYLAMGMRATGRRPGYYRTASGENIDAITLALAL